MTRSAAKIAIDDARGLNLLEVMVALAVVGLLAVVFLRGLTGYQSLRNLKLLANGLAGDLRLTQQYAVSRDADYQLVFLGGSPPTYEIRKASDASTIKQVEMPADVTTTNTFASSTVVFTPTGAPNAPGGICLTDTAGNSLTLRVRTGTGKVQTLEGLVSECAP